MRLRRILTLVAGLAAFALVAGALPAGATHSTTVEVFATGLNNPRGLDVAPGGAVYIAEAGVGGDLVCFEGPEGETCAGLSGSITKADGVTQTRIRTGLISGAGPDGSFAGGPQDVDFVSPSQIFVAMGLGGDPAEVIPPGSSVFRNLGKLLRFSELGGGVGVAADIAGFEAAADPDGNGVDSNPNSVLVVGGTRYVADSGGNTVVAADAGGIVSTVSVLPDILVNSPPFIPGLPPKIPMQAVPTSLAMGPDGFLYVGQLTGFPFPIGGARVFRIGPTGVAQTFAGGFTNILDIAFHPDGSLYVLEMATNSLLFGDPTGALWRVSPTGSRHRVLGGPDLFFPTGLAIGADGSIYVSNCGVCPGADSPFGITGHVLKITVGGFS